MLNAILIYLRFVRIKVCSVWIRYQNSQQLTRYDFQFIAIISIYSSSYEKLK